MRGEEHRLLFEGRADSDLSIIETMRWGTHWVVIICLPQLSRRSKGLDRHWALQQYEISIYSGERLPFLSCLVTLFTALFCGLAVWGFYRVSWITINFAVFSCPMSCFLSRPVVGGRRFICWVACAVMCLCAACVELHIISIAATRSVIINKSLVGSPKVGACGKASTAGTCG